MRLQTLLNLTARDYIVALATVPVVVAVRIALWVLPSRAIVRAVSRVNTATDVGVSNPRINPATIVWAVEAVSRRLPRATCLTQALAAKLLLRCWGLHAQLCLGVARNADGTLRAHAWLERDGRPILGGAGVHSMVRLPEFPDGPHIPAPLSR